MSFLKTVEGKNFIEHHDWYYEEIIPESKLPVIPPPILFQNRKEAPCVYIDATRMLHSSYYVGVDWLNDDTEIFIEPKLHKDSATQTNYLQMLFDSLKHHDAVEYTYKLFEIKWNKKFISIEQTQDLLTPLLVVQFLRIVQQIVRKGLKKSYYHVDRNLNGRIKGKIQVSRTIQKNQLQGKTLLSYCGFDEFGLNCPENRLIKKVLIFVQRYLPTIPNLSIKPFSSEVFNYIFPAFEEISEEVNHYDVVNLKTRVFYKEYEEAIRIGKLILRRFGYNITNISDNKIIQIPPFWIDMSKLFELYVLGKLRDTYGNSVVFQSSAEYGNPDYLLNTGNEKIIIDAKYKTYYKEGLKGQAQGKRDNIVKDIRQLSGYSRDRKIRDYLKIENAAIIHCLIVFPDQKSSDELPDELISERNAIPEFLRFYKCGIKLPIINT